MRICVIVPTLNEAQGIEAVLRQVKPYADEVLVIDGGSVDGTPTIAASVAGVTVLRIAEGKGLATRVGLSYSDCEVVVFLDADGSHEPEDIPRLVEPIMVGAADIVVASRISGGSDEFTSNLSHVVRWLGTKAVTRMVNVCCHAELTDVVNGFRAFNAARVKTLPLRANGFEIEVELLVKALWRNLRVVEVPSREYRRKWGVSKLATLDGVPMMLRLLLHVWRDMIGSSTSAGAFRARTHSNAGVARHTSQSPARMSRDMSILAIEEPANRPLQPTGSAGG